MTKSVLSAIERNLDFFVDHPALGGFAAFIFSTLSAFAAVRFAA